MGYLVMNRSDGGVSVRIGVEAADDFAGHVAHWESKPKQVARGWTVASFAYSEADPRPDREFRAGWEGDGGGGIQIPIAKARVIARTHMTKLLREELALLDNRRTQAELEGDATLIGQIDARKTSLQSVSIPQIRDSIVAATSVAELKATRQDYLTSQPSLGPL